MKKLIAGVAAGALLLSVAGVAFARGYEQRVSSVNQHALTGSVTAAVSVSGANNQYGGGDQTMYTGDSISTAKSITVGNVSVGGNGDVKQGAKTGSLTVAGSVSGFNNQYGSSSRHHSSDQLMGTGVSDSYAGSLTVSNVSVQ